MDNRYYIPSFKRKEFNSLYIVSIVYFIMIFLSPLIIMEFYHLINRVTNNSILSTFYKENNILITILVVLCFIILFIYSRIKLIKSLTTVYFIDGNTIIKGSLKIKEISSNKKGVFKDFLFSSFEFEKRIDHNSYSIKKGKNYLIEGILNNTDYYYVVENFNTELYDKTIDVDVRLETEHFNNRIYKSGNKQITISKLYTNDSMYLDYAHFYGNNGLIKAGFKKLVMVNLGILLLCSVDLLINYNLKYLDKVKNMTSSIDYRLVDYGYNTDHSDLLKLNYDKDDSNISIILDKFGRVTSINASIYLNDFIDIATVRFIMNDMTKCDKIDIEEYVAKLYDCIEGKCNYDDFSIKCDKYKFLIDEKYVIIEVDK